MTEDVRSRRRGKALEAAIYDAVWEELAEHGFGGLTMEGVARRAGTSKPVLYRRWSNRLEMMAATAMHFLPTTETIPDAGSLRENTMAVLRVLRGRMHMIGREALLGILTEIAAEPNEHESLFNTLMGYMRKIMTDVSLDRAIANGEITEDQITPRLRTLPIDLARMEFIMTGELTEEAIEEIVEEVFLPALRARER